LYFALRTVLNDNPVACALESFDAEYELQDKAEARLSRVG
jgi:hypothetical protein